MLRMKLIGLWFENTHEAIVDKKLFDRVRAVMDKKVEESIFTL